MILRTMKAAALAVAIAGAAVSAQAATTVFDTGATPTNGGYLLGEILGGKQDLYFRFTSNVDVLDTVGLYANVYAAAPVTLKLFQSDAAPSAGATEVASATFNITAGSGWSYATGLNFALLQNVSYWVSFSAAGNNISVPAAAINPLDGYGFTSGGTVYSNPTMNIAVSGTGHLNDTGAVPEPATWALMIGGFGLAGVALRRRRELAA